MVIACKGIDILKRVLCLLLCVVLLFCFFMVPRASAVALEATTIAYGGLLVGTILVGAGVVFSSHGDMVKVGNAMYKTLVNGSSAIGKTISSISAWAVEHGTSLAKGALRVGKDMYQAIVDAFNASYSSGKFSYPVDVTSINRSNADAFCDSFNALHLKNASFTDSDGVKHTLICSKESDGYYVKHYVDGAIRNSTGGLSGIADYAIYLHYFNSSHDVEMRLAYSDSGAWSNYGYWTDVFDVPASGSVSSGAAVSVNKDLVVGGSDLSYPSDDYLVKMPDIPSVDTATGDITYPNDTAYTKDAVAAPYPIGDDGVKVPDIPFDIPVDQTSGKPMDDTGTDTDTPSKPGEGTDTDNPNWPDTGSLSLPKLIASKFPFCIPFDVARLVGLLEAEPKAPVFRIPVVYANIVNEEIVIDFDKFADVLQIIRWGEIMLFVAGLVVITRNYIKW